MKKFNKVMLALVLVAGALFTNVSGFVGADTAITAEAASSKNPYLYSVEGNIAWVRIASGHTIKSATVNGKKAKLTSKEMIWLNGT